MEPFIVHTGRVAALPRANVDTDQIIPKQFLKRIERTGFGPALFFDWRYLPDGSPDPAFELNAPKAAGATLLLAGENFGCGFRAVLAPSFADLFHGNCCQNGLLPVTLPAKAVQELLGRYDAAPDGYELTVDLLTTTVRDARGFESAFDISAYRREMLLHGLDEIGRTLQQQDAIAAFERAHR